VACCGEPWVAAYSRRAREMMMTFLREGAWTGVLAHTAAAALCAASGDHHRR